MKYFTINKYNNKSNFRVLKEISRQNIIYLEIFHKTVFGFQMLEVHKFPPTILTYAANSYSRVKKASHIRTNSKCED